MQITENIHERKKECCSSLIQGRINCEHVPTHSPTRQKRFPKVQRRSFQPGDYWWWPEACEQQWGWWWWWWGTKLARGLSLSLSHTHTDQLRLVLLLVHTQHDFVANQVSSLITAKISFLCHPLSSSVWDSGVWKSGEECGVWSAVEWGKFFLFCFCFCFWFCFVGFCKKQFWTKTFVVSLVVSKERREEKRRSLCC